jgi:hypothetical protein
MEHLYNFKYFFVFTASLNSLLKYKLAKQTPLFKPLVFGSSTIYIRPVTCNTYQRTIPNAFFHELHICLQRISMQNATCLAPIVR